jgi:hypothetical protein
MLSIVDKVKQNNYRTGRVLQMYIEAIHKARSLSHPLPIPKREEGLSSQQIGRSSPLRIPCQPTIERSFLEESRCWWG